MKLTSCLEILSRFIFRSETSGIILQSKQKCHFSKKKFKRKRIWNIWTIQTNPEAISILIICMFNNDIQISVEEEEP